MEKNLIIAFVLFCCLDSAAQNESQITGMNNKLINSGTTVIFKEGVIVKEVEIQSSPINIWRSWTTEEGIKTFFASKCSIDFKPGGKYEMYFHDGPVGQRGSEGCTILNYFEGKMLSFTWNSETRFPNLRDKFTYVVLEFDVISENRTKVRLTNLGYKTGPEWEESLKFFDSAWGLALENLRKSFEESHWKFGESN